MTWQAGAISNETAWAINSGRFGYQHLIYAYGLWYAFYSLSVARCFTTYNNIGEGI